MQLDAVIDRLVAFRSSTGPVVSLYLDGRPDQPGRERYGDRIVTWLHDEARPSAKGLAIFAGEGEFFEAVQLDAPIEQNALFVDAAPRVHPLVRLGKRNFIPGAPPVGKSPGDDDEKGES